MDTPEIYVACLAAYNDSQIYGRWVDATQGLDEIYKDIFEMLAESPIENAEEYAIHDYSGFGDIELGKYESIERVASIAEFIAEHGELGAALLSDYSIEEAETLLEERYHGSYDDEVDFAYAIFEDCYSNAIPDNLMCYFDYVAFTRDLFMCDYFSVEANNKTHVFSTC